MKLQRLILLTAFSVGLFSLQGTSSLAYTKYEEDRIVERAGAAGIKVSLDCAIDKGIVSKHYENLALRNALDRRNLSHLSGWLQSSNGKNVVKEIRRLKGPDCNQKAEISDMEALMPYLE